MEKRDKIIITGMIIVIIALIAGLAFMLTGNNLSVGDGAPEGMKMYDFNSEFKMAVPNNVKFLKSWNNSDDAVFGQGYQYFDKNNEIVVSYVDSPMITHEFMDTLENLSDSLGNATIEHEGDLIISHNKNDGIVGKSVEESNFTESVILQKGHMAVGVSGNDLDLIKSMIKTVEFYE